MNDSPLVIRLPNASVGKLAALRLAAGVKVAQHEDFLWLRVDDRADSLDSKLRGLPHAERFVVIEGDALAREGHRVPSARLPQLQWRPLKEFIRPKVPTTQLAARHMPTVAVSLVLDATLGEPNVLLTTLDTWTAYASTAPQVRLAQWTFAVAADQRVIVRGAPIPPIRGMRLVEQHGVAVEAGYRTEPHVAADVLADGWQVAPGELIMLTADAPPQRIAAEEFVGASRSAVRHTQGSFANGH